MWILNFYEQEKIKRREKGERYLLRDMSKELGCTPQYLSNILSGKLIISTKMADKFAEKTAGELDADRLLEISVKKHRKYLDRKERFGDRLKFKK